MSRRYDFDWLRLFGAVLVVVAHSAGLFSTWAPAFGNIQRTTVFDELLWNLNLWIMPLFMLLAGASVWFTLRKRTNRQYLRERLVHLGLPLVVLTVTFSIPVAFYGRSSIGLYSGSLFEFYLHFFDIFPTGTFHLWFIAYLLIYVPLTLPLFRFLQTASGRRLIDKLARACQHTGGIYLFALPLLAVQLALSGLSGVQGPLVAPPNEWTRFGLFMLDFTFGYILLSDARFQEAIARQWPLALAGALAGSLAMFAIAWPDSFDPARDLPLDYSWWYIAFWTVFAISSWAWLIVWLGFGQRFLNADHPLLKRAGAASYPLYLLHPIVLLPAILLVAQWEANALIAFLVLTTIALVGTSLLAELAKRWSVTRFILGLKTKHAVGRSEIRHAQGDADWSHAIAAVGE